MIYKDRVSSKIEEKVKKSIGKLRQADEIDASILQTMPYEYPQRKITVSLTSDEFTCVCPFSGLPDFAHLLIEYTPRKKLIEMKSLKYYLYSYRNVKIYNEHVVNKILEDLVKVLSAYTMKVTGEFTVRGGMKNTVTAQFLPKSE